MTYTSMKYFNQQLSFMNITGSLGLNSINYNDTSFSLEALAYAFLFKNFIRLAIY